MDAYLGVDVGSVSTNLVLIDEWGEIIDFEYLRTQGQPIKAIQDGLRKLAHRHSTDLAIRGCGSTGSARFLTGAVVGADVVKNEITSHALAALKFEPKVRTIFEIGGQDSKVTFLKDQVVVDFAMNTICAAGTGSFLDHQATRLGLPIETFGELALKAEKGVQIAGRCTVFAESDMIHKQQTGYPLEEIVYGLCQALVRNYLNNLLKGKQASPPVVFQGGVAANQGMRRAFEEALGFPVIVPPYFNVMGAIGVALLTRTYIQKTNKATNFKGFEIIEFTYDTESFFCDGCSNNCEVAEIRQGGETLARWGSRCGKWEVGSLEESRVFSLL